jgi:hypothetical protein
MISGAPCRALLGIDPIVRWLLVQGGAGAAMRYQEPEPSFGIAFDLLGRPYSVGLIQNALDYTFSAEIDLGRKGPIC